jgi:HlyD family secretion protein
VQIVPGTPDRRETVTTALTLRRISIVSTAVHPSSNTGVNISDLQLKEHERDTGSSMFGSKFFWIILLALIAGGAWWYQKNQGKFTEWTAAATPEFDTAKVAPKEHNDVALELSGFIVPYRKVNVSPRIPGTVMKLTIDVGKTVKEGELLAQLDDVTYQADVLQAEAALKAARSRLDEIKAGALPEDIEQARTAVAGAKSKVEFLKKELAREESLGDSALPAQLDSLKSTLNDAEVNASSMEQKLAILIKGVRAERRQAAEADITQAEAVLSKAKYILDNTKIFAPLDGTVLEKNTQVGEILRPEVLSTSLCILADLTTLEVEVDVQERDLQKVEVGRLCRIIPDAYPDRKYEGKVDRIQPMVNRSRGVVRVTIRISEQDRYLLPDMNVRAIIENPPVTENVAETLWIPDAAVVKEGDDAVVFKLDQDKVHRQTVQLGSTEGKQTQVTSGLKAGDVVVLPGKQTLIDGKTVRTKTAKK